MAAAAEAISVPTDLRRNSATSGALTVAPTIGHITTLKDIFLAGYADGDYVDVALGQKWMIRVYAEVLDSIMIDSHVEAHDQHGFLSWMKDIIPEWADLYAAHDQNLVITPSSTYTALTAYFTKTADTAPGDKTRPGGSESRIRDYIYWLTHSGTLSADATNAVFNAELMPSGAPTLVSEDRLPVTEQFDLSAIICGNEDDSSDTHLDAVKIIDEGTTLFSPETKEGFLVDPASGNELQCDVLYRRIWKSPEPYVMGKGHRYGFLYDVNHITTTRAANYYKLGLVGVHKLL